MKTATFQSAAPQYVLGVVNVGAESVSCEAVPEFTGNNEWRTLHQQQEANLQMQRFGASGLHKQAAARHEIAAQCHREAAALHEAAMSEAADLAAERAWVCSGHAHQFSEVAVVTVPMQAK